MNTYRQLKLPLGNPLLEEAVKPLGTVREPNVIAAPVHQKLHGEQNVTLMEQLVSKDNLEKALKQIEKKKKKAPGVDGMRVPELRAFLNDNGRIIREQLLSGIYEPQPVLRMEIPKDGGGGMRQLGIPTVLDRWIQQALLQVLTPIFDPIFSEESFGFRPGRSQHKAINRSLEHIRNGKTWVVDMDLSKFFDRVNHDMLMARVARRVEDKLILTLIRKYLESGVMIDGVVVDTNEGTPQGGPLSPLLSNVLLDDLDKELEQRGHSFVRFADDCAPRTTLAS